MDEKNVFEQTLEGIGYNENEILFAAGTTKVAAVGVKLMFLGAAVTALGQLGQSYLIRKKAKELAS